MFGLVFSRWRKASTCMKLLEQLQSRLKLLKNKKCELARLLRGDIVVLLKIKHSTYALHRAEQLILAEKMVMVYDMLLQFTNLIILHFSSIEKHREFLNDEINEAVSSLVFASTRCGEEVPELVSIRDLFRQRYGQRFVSRALRLLPGHLVSHEMKELLWITSVPEGIKSKLLDEIAKTFDCSLGRLQYTPEIDKQVNKEEEKKVMDSDLNKKSPDEVYKFSLTDFEEEVRKEEALSSMEDDDEDDYIEEALQTQSKKKLLITSVSKDVKSNLLDGIAKESGRPLKKLRTKYTPENEEQVNEEEEKNVTDSEFYSCSDEPSPDEAYKSSLTDVEEEIINEEKSLMEDDHIEEAQVGKDQRELRVKERCEEERRRSSTSTSLLPLKEFMDMESTRYYKRRTRVHQRRRRSSIPSAHCCPN
ncbi:hypothetical protein CARUB_v10011365mg [Capsella rubella]|uniref:IST1-like protein n=1 Tax=Capsella rubella TaxID=81985 RepID=R0IE82_9BRAS|nr:hypothetical protein CARUB_v10011365mg [Capsella rubella]